MLFSIHIRVRAVSMHPMSSWNILQCKWNDSCAKLPCGHVLRSHKRHHRRFVHHLSRRFILSRSIINSHCVRCGHVQQCRRLEHPVHGLPGGQVLSGWVGDSVSTGYLQPCHQCVCPDSVLDVPARVVVRTGCFRSDCMRCWHVQKRAGSQ